MISAVEVEALRVERGGRALVDGLSFRVEAGEALALTGPNGAGKTSLLRCLAGLLRPAAGAVRFYGPAGELDPAEARGRGLHWLGPHDGLKGHRTVEHELDFWARWSGAEPDRSALAAMGLQAQRRLDVRRLSTGQRRRLALARLLAAPRSLWLLDEPLAPLDGAWRERTGAAMRERLASGGLIVAAVHDPLPVAARTLALGEAA
jgi:heme exporter protein A